MVGLVWSGFPSQVLNLFSSTYPISYDSLSFFSKSTSSHFSFLAASTRKVTDSFVLVGLLHVGDSVYLWFFSTIAITLITLDCYQSAWLHQRYNVWGKV